MMQTLNKNAPQAENPAGQDSLLNFKGDKKMITGQNTKTTYDLVKNTGDEFKDLNSTLLNYSH